jgi:hypothetical protein
MDTMFSTLEQTFYFALGSTWSILLGNYLTVTLTFPISGRPRVPPVGYDMLYAEWMAYFL